MSYPARAEGLGKYDKNYDYQKIPYAGNSISLTIYEISVHIYIYIVIDRQTVSWYHNFSEWLYMRNASSWNQNAPDLASNEQLIYCQVSVNEGFFLVYIHIRLSATGVLNSREELCIHVYIYI